MKEWKRSSRDFNDGLERWLRDRMAKEREEEAESSRLASYLSVIIREHHEKFRDLYPEQSVITEIDRQLMHVLIRSRVYVPQYSEKPKVIKYLIERGYVST